MRDTPIFKFFLNLGGLGFYILPFLLGVFLVFSWFQTNFLLPVDPTSTETVGYQVQAGKSLENLAKELEEKGLVNNSLSIKWLGEIRKKNKEKPFSLKAGEVALSRSMKPSEILDALSSGEIVAYQVGIPAGATVKDVAVIMAKTELVNEKQAYDALRNQRLMAQLGVPAYIPEGYLLEGGYSFQKPITAEQIVEEIVKTSKATLTTNLGNWQARASELGYRPYEILVLASILYRETSGDISEQAKVSAVYHNRLRIGMQLQSEKTLRYGLPDLPLVLGESDRAIESPYNTFLNIGLPPTPVCSPSLEAIRAALYPDDSDHLYFFKTPQGKFVYSSTFKEHQKKLSGKE
jgi:UPF0755 protein